MIDDNERHSPAAAVSLGQLKRELDQALQAVAAPGAGNLANLECRLADLQQRFIATPAADLAGVETRLVVIRDLVAGLGPRGYLLDLVDASLADVRALTSRSG